MKPSSNWESAATREMEAIKHSLDTRFSTLHDMCEDIYRFQSDLREAA